MKRFKMMALCVLISIPLLVTSLMAQEKSNSYVKKTYIDESGDMVTMFRYAGFPPKELPLANTELPKEMRKEGEKGFYALSNVPSYDWSYGCTATAASIIAAYYDSYGAPTVYTGPANGGVAPMTNAVWDGQASQADTSNLPIAASKQNVDGRSGRGHGDDYWTGYLDEATDPYYGAWAEHNHSDGQRCVADFMGTNQWYNWQNADGSTSIWTSPYGVYDYTGAESGNPPQRDGIHGYRLFYEDLGFTVDRNFTKTILGYDDPDDSPDMGPATTGYTFTDYKNSIDKGRPVFIQIEGHSMVGFGYDDSYNPPRLYLRDTWDRNTSSTAHYMVWGGVYSNMQHYAISEIILGSECYWAEPQNITALNNNRSVTVGWSDPSKGTKNVTYKVYRDSWTTPIATGVTGTSYVDNGATDGVHYYAVKATYVDDSKDSFLSNQVSVYVSPSVTSFYDGFESGSGQWLFKKGDPGYTQSWGIETSPKYAGNNSLTSTVGTGNYVDQMYLGIFAEVAPGLNFATAADANCTFWVYFSLEPGFDYAYFQSSTDGINWETLATYNGVATSWNYHTINLGLYAGNSNVRFRWMLYTDDATNAVGINIDEFNITPSSIDGAAPYVWYTREADFYTSETDGFEITTEITDYTGIDYARVLYKVNGGSELTANPTSVNGSTYHWKLPVQNPGDMIEYRFDVRDTYSPPNQAFKGPYYYVDGLHQKYDSGVQGGIVSATTATTQYAFHSHAQRFSNFYDDLKGVVIRGYRDERPEYDSADMLISVWPDDSGLPGTAKLVTDVIFPNPATYVETYKWGYCDLSSYSALNDMVGDYYIGFRCRTGQTVNTLMVITDTGEAGEYYYGRSFYYYYLTANDASSLVWEQATGWNYHMRAVTTDNQVQPGTIDPSPNALAKTLPPSSTSSEELKVYNSGGFALDYTASIDYNGFASGGLVTENNFNTALGWTSSGTLPWSRVTTWDGGSLNGTGFAKVSAAGTGASTSSGYLTSATMNLSTYGYVTISWIQKVVCSGTNYARLQVSNDGTNWTTLYTTSANVGAWSNGDAQTAIVPSQFFTSTARFRFEGYFTARSNRYYAVDDVVINGSVPFAWMTLDGGSTTSGTGIAPAAYDPITVGYNSTGLADGKYTANIRLSSAYSNESVYVELTVANVTPPAAPSLTSPTNASNLVDLSPYFDWSDAATATSYNIVVDNNSGFTSPEVDTQVSVSNYQQVTNLAAGTYYWKVRSYNAGGYSAFTSAWTVNLQTPTATFSVTDLAGAAIQGNSDGDTFNIGNSGSASLSYTITTSYVTAKADLTLLTNNFNSVIGWTPSDYLVWAQSTDLNYDIDGTGYAKLTAHPTDDANGSSAGVLTSPVFDGSTSYEVWIDFDQLSVLTTSSCLVDYTTDGVAWTNVYTNTTSTNAHQRIKLPNKSATMQIRFKGNMKNQSGSYWSVDNVVVEGLNPANYAWLTVTPLSGSVAVSGSTTITTTYNSTGMDVGTYNANITVSSNDQNTPTTVIPVQFVVSSGSVVPAVPANLVTSVVSGNIFINWDDAADATNYDVYSSANPYGTFAFLANVTLSEYTYVPGTNTKMFFYVVSKNATKVDTPETIEVKAIDPKKIRTKKEIKEDSTN
jgi:hypothetical protein